MNKPALTAPLIAIHKATVWRGTTCVLQDFSLCIGQRERVAVLGPNGSGKTTLLRTISRELRPVQAEGSYVEILGQRSWNIWELRKHFGLVSQDLQADFGPQVKVLDAVLSGFFQSVGLDDVLRTRVSAGQRETAHRILQELGLQALEQRAFHTLSTGQQRRCLLARALVHEPHTLILDEPSSGLDMTARFEIQRHVSRLCRQGIGLVWVTHDLNDIPAEVERVIVLKGGRIFADGPRADVLNTEVLCAAFDTSLRVAEVDGHYLAYPAPL
jgi:iron complex transport system ATP-binding protein